ncbi:hypothetical protein [Roseisolibacter agri]|uniref:Outer membrane protein beta-barrel domain-containing protein n=1 Tax=Roseisolibacter agri TaxID=2014610 RepID=A0AA37QDS5_9BACT|nr:hypothetical protein [Roseisolibacter agri]GLC27916.1 hypothetical protein rosag_44290 [Roseisolibacter agri]
MRFPSLRVPVLVACTLAATQMATATAATAQDRRREESDRARRERLQREREEREDREYRARLRQREQQREALRRAEEQRERVARERAERERRLREALAERRRRDDWRDSYRPRLSLGGGFDVRSFGGDDNRYLVQGGVDFRARSGLGVRPEVLFAWTDPTANLPIIPCAACAGQPLINVSQPTTRGRSRMIGVAVSGTYTLARSSPVRPYLMSGLGVFSTRTPQVEVTVAGATPAGAPNYQANVNWRNDVDVGLTAGAGLEFDLGPARLFTEFRYLLTDQPRLRGFGGMMPLTAGLRL